MTCCKCGRADDGTGARDLRPYGPGGAPICAECGLAPEQIATTEMQFREALDAAGPVAILTSKGPRKLRV